MRILGSRERHLFNTHKPPSRSREWGIGRVVEHQGRLYSVTKWVELPRVALDRGGSVGQWEVWGRRVSERQMKHNVVSAAEAILDDSDTEEG